METLKMNDKIDYAANLDARAALFKALGHPARLLMVNLIQSRPRHGEELAAILNLNPATVSHHLSILSQTGVLESHKDQYYQVYSLVSGVLDKTLAQVVQLPQPALTAGVTEDAFRQKVLKTFLKHGRLVQIPAQTKKFRVILEKLVQEFEPERDYTEKEVNQILVEFFDDVAHMRRSMIDFGLMQRAHGIYRRVE
jgi:biotin operon repressor